MAKNDNLKDFLADLADAIREKKGTSDPINPQDFTSEIASIETGGGEDVVKPIIQEKDVNFYDYDGTLLYSYTWSQAQKMTKLPPLPSRQGLICQEWNYTLEDIKAQNGQADVGATYITDDGKTRLYISVDKYTGFTFDLSLTKYNNNAKAIVDFGDGTIIEHQTNKATHTYEEEGEYIITIEVVSSKFYLNSEGSTNTGYGCTIFGYYTSQNDKNLALTKVEIGENILLREGTFNYCGALSEITIPKEVTCGLSGQISQPLFNSANLKFVSCPRNFGRFRTTYPCFCKCSWGANTYDISHSIEVSSSGTHYSFIPKPPQNTTNFSLTGGSPKYLRIPTINGNFSLYGLPFLYEIRFDGNVNNIGSLQTLNRMQLYDFSRLTQIPTLSSTTISGASGYKIYVPAELYGVWSKSTNWSNNSDNIVMDFEPTECISLSIIADNVIGNLTQTNIRATAICNGYTILSGEYKENISVGLVEPSSEFPQNLSTADTIEREVSFTYLGKTATATFKHLPYVDYRIVCKYDVTSISSATKLINTTYSYLSRMFVDGVEYPISTTHTFDTMGEHEVVFDVINDADVTNLSNLFYNVTSLVEVDCSKVDLSLATSTSTNNGTAYMFCGCKNLKKITLPSTTKYLGYYMFINCTNVVSLTIMAKQAPKVYGDNTFYNSSSSIGYSNSSSGINKLYVPHDSEGYDEGYWTSILYSSYCGFTKDTIYEPTECTSLDIKAQDVNGRDTTTMIRWDATTNGFDGVSGDRMTNVLVSGSEISSEFPQNLSTTDTIEREVSFTYLGKTATATFKHLPYVDYRIVCKYDVTSISSATKLINTTYSYLSRMFVDGVEYPISKTHTFDTMGEHEVVFEASNGVAMETLYRLFYNCSYLIEADLSDIDMSLVNTTSSSNGTSQMFYGCSRLKKIILPKTTVSLGYSMFQNCNNVEELVIYAKSAPTFYNYNSLGSSSGWLGYNFRTSGTNKLYVPLNAEGYDTGYWKTYLYSTSYCGFTKVEMEF